MPAVQRARRRERPGLPHHPGRARRRRVGGDGPEDLVHLRRRRVVRHPAGPHRPRRREAPWHLLLPVSHGCPRDRRAAHPGDDRRLALQRGVPGRGATAGRRAGGRARRRLAPGPGHARQRAGVAVLGRDPVGDGPDRGRGAGAGPPRGRDRPAPAPGGGGPAHRGVPAGPVGPAGAGGGGGGRGTGTGGVAQEAPGRRARPAPHGTGRRPGGARRHGGSRRPVAHDVGAPARSRRRRPGCRPPGRVAVELPVRPGPHHRGWHHPGAAQHPGRTGPGPSEEARARARGSSDEPRRSGVRRDRGRHLGDACASGATATCWWSRSTIPART